MILSGKLEAFRFKVLIHAPLYTYKQKNHSDEWLLQQYLDRNLLQAGCSYLQITFDYLPSPLDDLLNCRHNIRSV